MGANDVGQTNTPPTLTNVAAIAGGGGTSLALVGTGLPAPAFVLSRPVVTGAVVSLSVTTALGRTYCAEFANSLPPTNWTMLPPVAGDGTVKTFTDPNASSTRRFYRAFQK